MRSRLIGILYVLVLLCGHAFAQGAGDPASQGKWTVIGAQHGGKPMDGLTGGIMTVTGNRFEIHTAGGSVLKGSMQFDMKAKPAVVAMLHDSGMRWEAIYDVRGDDFKLNYVDAGGRDKLPTDFKTSADTEATLIILKRAKP